MIVAPHSPTVSAHSPTVLAHSPTVSEHSPTASEHSALQCLVIKHAAMSRRVHTLLTARCYYLQILEGLTFPFPIVSSLAVHAHAHTPVVSLPMGYPPSPPQRRPAPPTPIRLRLHCSTTQASMTMRMRMRFGTGGDDHRRGKERATRTSTRGTSLALVSPLSRPTLSNRSPAFLLSPLSLLYLLDIIPTGPLARSPASPAPPRASSAFPGSSLDTPASPTRRHSQSLTPLSYYGLEPLLRHASPRPPPR